MSRTDTRPSPYPQRTYFSEISRGTVFAESVHAMKKYLYIYLFYFLVSFYLSLAKAGFDDDPKKEYEKMSQLPDIQVYTIALFKDEYEACSNGLVMATKVDLRKKPKPIHEIRLSLTPYQSISLGRTEHLHKLHIEVPKFEISKYIPLPSLDENSCYRVGVEGLAEFRNEFAEYLRQVEILVNPEQHPVEFFRFLQSLDKIRIGS